MKTSLKQQLHDLIDSCENELLLEETRILLESGSDWWNELPEQDKNLLMESEAKYGKGIFISHEELMKRHLQWQNEIDLSIAQKNALDKELEAIRSNPDYLKKWDELKVQFKKS